MSLRAAEPMDLIEPAKRLAERATGIGVPSITEALAAVRDCRPVRMKFRDDGYIPNNPRFSLLVYRTAVRLGRKHDPAALLERIITAHGWGEDGETASTTLCIITR